MSEEIKIKEICPRCKKEVSQLFYNYKQNPLCKDCLNFVLKEANKTINAIRNFAIGN